MRVNCYNEKTADVFGDEGAIMIGEALKTNTTLTDLRLRCDRTIMRKQVSKEFYLCMNSQQNYVKRSRNVK